MDLPKSCLSYLNFNPSFFFFLSVVVENHPTLMTIIILKSESLCSSQFFVLPENPITLSGLILCHFSNNFSLFQHSIFPSHPCFQLTTEHFFFTERNKVQKWFVFPVPHLKISFHRILVLVRKLNFTRCQLFFSNQLFSWNYIVICNCVFLWKVDIEIYLYFFYAPIEWDDLSSLKSKPKLFTCTPDLSWLFKNISSAVFPTLIWIIHFLFPL